MIQNFIDQFMLFLPVTLPVLLIGYVMGKLTRRVSWWKILLFLYLLAHIYAPLRNNILLGISFTIGLGLNHIGTFFQILGWARGLGDVFYALRYRRAYEDIRRREAELEERERRVREQEARMRAESGTKSRTQQQWQQEAKQRRRKSSGSSQGGGRGDDRRTDDTYSHTYKYKNQPQKPYAEQKRNECLKVLGLKPGREYSPGEIKAAYRRAVKRTHPDAGGSSVEFIEVQNAYEWLRKNL